MKLNADFNKNVVIDTLSAPWQPSPLIGVERLLLDRIGDEVARATSLVRYQPGSSFDAHKHEMGEEFLVLDGTFADEHGEYPTGTYVRNPPGSAHSPSSPAGCTIFVKLRQFDSEDTRQCVINTNTQVWRPGLVDGLSVMPLHDHKGEHVALVKWAPHTQFTSHQHWGGEEILVLDGVFYDEHGIYPKGTWLRSHHLSQHTPFTKSEGAVIFVKTGHLPT